LHAWAESKLPALDKMNAIIQSMRNEGIPLDEVSYNNLLKYWRMQGAVDQFEGILDTMKVEGMRPSTMNLSWVIWYYAKVGNTEKAEELLREMLKVKPKDRREVSMIGLCVHRILLAYRRILDDPSTFFAQRDRALERAESLFKKMKKGLTKEDEGEETDSVAEACFDIDGRIF
jgi:hypothetical protein